MLILSLCRRFCLHQHPLHRQETNIKYETLDRNSLLGPGQFINVYVCVCVCERVLCVMGTYALRCYRVRLVSNNIIYVIYQYTYIMWPKKKNLKLNIEINTIIGVKSSSYYQEKKQKSITRDPM